LAANASTGDLTVLVPGDLAAPVYDVTIQAELLAADKKVLAVVHAPVRRMTVHMPLVVRLDGAKRIEAPLDPKMGATLKILGKVERREGLKADVVLTLVGLPAGAKANPATLKAGEATQDLFWALLNSRDSSDEFRKVIEAARLLRQLVDKGQEVLQARRSLGRLTCVSIFFNLMQRGGGRWG
jgi:hypothetical protein